MKFRKISRWYNKNISRSHNSIVLGSTCSFVKEDSAVVKNSDLKINGTSSLRVSSGAFINNVRFQLDGNSHIEIKSGAHLENSDICVWNNSLLQIGSGCIIDGTRFVIERGHVTIGSDNRFSEGMKITVSDGILEVKDHNVLSNTIWVRFGGALKIDSYNCINNGSELRADEYVCIGSYNMISYYCDIWDTNTHSEYSLEEKSEMFRKSYPYIGFEKNKPKTKPVIIGDGNWFGKYSCVLKGSIIGNDVTVGTRTVVSNLEIGDGHKIVSSKSVVL